MSYDSEAAIAARERMLEADRRYVESLRWCRCRRPVRDRVYHREVTCRRCSCVIPSIVLRHLER